MKDKFFGSHELQTREEVVKTSSDRNFGYVFAGFFAILGSLSLYSGHHRWPWWFAAAVLFAVVATIVPRVLAPLNRLWAKFGLLLHMIISPVILAILFYGVFGPVGFLMRLFGKDPMQRSFDARAKSYWIVREPPGPAPDTFKQQF